MTFLRTQEANSSVSFERSFVQNKRSARDRTLGNDITAIDSDAKLCMRESNEPRYIGEVHPAFSGLPLRVMAIDAVVVTQRCD